jgi:hypothetical protein
LGDSVSSGKKYSDPQISRYLGLQCESTSLPGISLATADVKVYGPGYKVPYQKDFNGNSITMTFICTNDFYERKLFDRWIEAIMPPDTNNMRFPKGEQTKYLTDITVMQFDEFIKQIYAIKMIDAFPTSIAEQTVSWADDSFHRLSVTFSFHRYQTIYRGNYDIGQAVASGVGTIFDRFLGDFRQSIIT